MNHFPTASIVSTETRVFQASAVNQEYLISIALPFHYHDQPGKNYPVIYVLDANLYFGMVVEMVRTLTIRVPFCREFPDAVIVGIGYPVKGSFVEGFSQVMHLRMRDFLPVRDEGAEKFIQDISPVPDPVVSGAAGNFLKFIHQELVPFIESEYRVVPTDRTVMGFSWGGEFALYALFHQPRLFQRHVVVSPDLPYGNGAVLDYEQQYAEKNDTLPVRLYLAYGELEINDYELPFLNRFQSALEKRNYAGFRMSYQLIPRYDHCAMVAPGFLDGLVSVFT